MAGDPNQAHRFHLSGGVSNQDASLSLGGAFSNFGIEVLTQTVAAVAAAGATRVFLTSVNSGSLSDRITFVNGLAGTFETRIVGIDTGSDWVDLLEPLPFAAGIGDIVYQWRRGDGSQPWTNTSAQQCADGFTEYFGGYIEITVDTWTDWGLHIEEISPGNAEHEIAVSSVPGAILNTIANPQTEPDLAGMRGGGNRATFVRPLQAAVRTPEITFSGYDIYGFWLKRTIPPNTPRLDWQAVALVVSDNTGEISKCLFVWDSAGFTPDITLTHGPSIYVGGGGQYKANVKSLETGLDVPGVSVGMVQTAGGGTFYPPDAADVTDEHGNVEGRYSASGAVVDVGQTITVEAEV